MPLISANTNPLDTNPPDANPLAANPLFAGITTDDLPVMLNCLSAKTGRYQKGAVILLSGEAVSTVGILLSGKANIISEDANGRASLISEVSAGETFGEVFACAGVSRSPVTVEAAEDTEVLFVNYKKIITACSAACHFHTKLIENMLKLVAAKCLNLNRKIEILSKRTIRERLLLFFDMERGTATQFTVSYNREEMARYLCVDRSALSNELGKMRAEGLISFDRNSFEIKHYWQK